MSPPERRQVVTCLATLLTEAAAAVDPDAISTGERTDDDH